MIFTCLVLTIPPQAGAAGLHVFVAAVFFMYSIGYPIGHTAVRRLVFSSVACLSLCCFLFLHAFAVCVWVFFCSMISFTARLETMGTFVYDKDILLNFTIWRPDLSCTAVDAAA